MKCAHIKIKNPRHKILDILLWTKVPKDRFCTQNKIRKSCTLKLTLQKGFYMMKKKFGC